VVEHWKGEIARGSYILCSPTIQAAIMAGMLWLDIYWPDWRTSHAIDIRTTDRHPFASVGSVVLGLRCSWRPGCAPMPKIVGLHPLPPAASVRASGY
jgi:hypothetical protein